MKRKTYIIACLMMAAAMLLCCVTGVCAASTTNAAEQVELREDCTLDITYSSGKTVFSGRTVKLYHIANITSDAQYELCGAFADKPVTVTGTTSQTEWDDMTITLNSYILADGIEADMTQKTDGEGKVKFTGLTAGIYLISSIRTETAGKYYVFESFMAAVPAVGEDGRWIYDVSAKPKMSEKTPAKGEVTYTVLKTWKDEGSKTARPESVKIEIFKDGKLQETVNLEKENDWRHSWKTVDDGSAWSVVERDVPDGYKVAIRRNGDTFNVTNSRPSKHTVPKTGDTADMGMYIALMAISGGLLIALCVLLTRRKNAR